MPRRARFIVPGVPHHVTQRGNYRKHVFFASTDQLAYLRLLKGHAMRSSVEIAAYCLMPNHVHLVVVPKGIDDLHQLMRAVHGQYARRVNRMRGLTGHCWQGRFFSSPLDESYFINAVRYVELNPVRAGLVANAEDYPWSSAPAHCGCSRDLVIEPSSRWQSLSGIGNWSRWLAEGTSQQSVADLRRNLSQNLPCGSRDFVEQLEKTAGRCLRYRPMGRESAETKKGDSHL